MAATSIDRSKDIVLTFAWTGAIEDLYDSWRRRVVAAERGHRLMASRLRRRNLVVGGVAVLLTAVIGAGAFASLRGPEPHGTWIPGVEPDAALLVLGSIAVLAALLSCLQTFARYSTRAEGHRIAALRYEALRREMAQTLVTPPEARGQPDHALNDVRERVDRYEEESPPVKGS